MKYCKLRMPLAIELLIVYFYQIIKWKLNEQKIKPNLINIWCEHVAFKTASILLSTLANRFKHLAELTIALLGMWAASNPSVYSCNPRQIRSDLRSGLSRGQTIFLSTSSHDHRPQPTSQLLKTLKGLRGTGTKGIT